MVDAHALGACGLGRAGSNPASPTTRHAMVYGRYGVIRCWMVSQPRSTAICSCSKSRETLRIDSLSVWLIAVSILWKVCCSSCISRRIISANGAPSRDSRSKRLSPTQRNQVFPHSLDQLQCVWNCPLLIEDMSPFVPLYGKVAEQPQRVIED